MALVLRHRLGYALVMVRKILNILYEDDLILAVDKPSGLLVIPTVRNERHTLTRLLSDELHRRGLSVNAHPCHRLDRETSGVILYAKGKAMQQAVMKLFHGRLVKKTYIALVSGTPYHREGMIDTPIERRTAVTRYRVLRAFEDFSLVEVMPETGRTNQIRIHFKSIGHPLLGESRFAFRKDFEVKFKRVALHACRIELQHPVSGKPLLVEAPLPGDMQMLIDSRTPPLA